MFVNVQEIRILLDKDGKRDMIRVLLTSIRCGAGRRSILWRCISAAYCTVEMAGVFAFFLPEISVVKICYFRQVVACKDDAYFLRRFF